MQFQADLLGVPVRRPRVLETTAVGAAYLAGLGAGVWADREQLERAWQLDRRFEPTMPVERREELYSGWQRAVGRTRGAEPR